MYELAYVWNLKIAKFMETDNRLVVASHEEWWVGEMDEGAQKRRKN